SSGRCVPAKGTGVTNTAPTTLSGWRTPTSSATSVAMLCATTTTGLSRPATTRATSSAYRSRLYGPSSPLRSPIPARSSLRNWAFAVASSETTSSQTLWSSRNPWMKRTATSPLPVVVNEGSCFCNCSITVLIYCSLVRVEPDGDQAAVLIGDQSFGGPS